LSVLSMLVVRGVLESMVRTQVLAVPVAVVRAAACSALLLVGLGVGAQEIEPRLYSNAPVGTNFLLVGLTDARGALPTDLSSPLQDADFRTTSGLFAHVRALDLWGKSGKFDVIAPYTALSGTARYLGEPVDRDVDGFSDPRFRLSVNLYGAPALSPEAFASYRQDLVVGASLQVTAPVGQYDRTRLVNIGTNRWSLKPELGVSKAIGRWTLEWAVAATLYTDNDDFFNGRRRSQDPLYSTQGHLIYAFRSGVWGALDATYFTGGRTTLDGEQKNDLQKNWRIGGTLAFPIDRRNSLKIYGSTGVSARTGNDFDLFGIVWQYRWGGGS
jgi:hypothetical protein